MSKSEVIEKVVELLGDDDEVRIPRDNKELYHGCRSAIVHLELAKRNLWLSCPSGGEAAVLKRVQ